jgi:hypothetical protein
MTSDTEFTSLRGYALQWFEVGKLDGELQYFDHGAFNLQTNGPVGLTFRTHEAPEFAQNIELFVDEYGLGWAASVPVNIWDWTLRPAMRNGVQYCSGLFDIEKSETIKLADGRPCKRITKARIRHITLCSYAVFEGTGCWPAPAEIVGDYPPRIADLNSKWEKGRTRWLALRKPAPSPAKLVESRQQEYNEFIEGVLATVALGRPMLVGHSAFSKFNPRRAEWLKGKHG